MKSVKTKVIQQFISKILLASYSLLATTHATTTSLDIGSQLSERNKRFKKSNYRSPQQNNLLSQYKKSITRKTIITNLQEIDTREKEEQELQKELSYLKGGVHVLEEMLDNMDKHSEERKKTHKEFDENLKKMKEKFNKKIEKEEKKHKKEIEKLDKNIEKLRNEREESDKKNIKQLKKKTRAPKEEFKKIAQKNNKNKDEEIKKVITSVGVGTVVGYVTSLFSPNYMFYGAMVSGFAYLSYN